MRGISVLSKNTILSAVTIFDIEEMLVSVHQTVAIMTLCGQKYVDN